MADDIHHARLGWAHIASSFVSPAMRRELAAWLPHLLQAAAWSWTRKHRSIPFEGFPAHGMPALATTRAVVRDTLQAVILPGFDRLRVPTAPARDWWARQYDSAAENARTQGYIATKV